MMIPSFRSTVAYRRSPICLVALPGVGCMSAHCHQSYRSGSTNMPDWCSREYSQNLSAQCQLKEGLKHTNLDDKQRSKNNFNAFFDRSISISGMSFQGRRPGTPLLDFDSATRKSLLEMPDQQNVMRLA